MNTRLATLLTGLLALSLALLPACKKSDAPAAGGGDQPAPQAAKPADTPQPADAPAPAADDTAVPAAYTIGVVLGQGAVAKTVEAGMNQVAPANGTTLKVGGDAKALIDQKVNAILLVGVGGDAAKAASEAKVPVVVVAGEAAGKPAAKLAAGTALDTLSEAQAKELGRVAVETAFSLLKGDKDVATDRPMQSIL